MFRRPPRSTRTATLFPYTTLFRSPEFTKLPAQITGGAAQIAMQAVAIDPELLCRAGHQLAEPESTLGAQGHRIVPALLDQHRVHESDRQTGFARSALHKRVKNAPTIFGGPPETARGKIGRGRAIRSEARRGGKAGVRQLRSRWARVPEKTKH